MPSNIIEDRAWPVVEAMHQALAFAPAIVSDGGPSDDQLTGTPDADQLSGRSGDDRLTGLNGADDLLGGPGSDRLAGNRGPDKLQGGEGADWLRGGAGRDVLDGGRGADLLVGGDGADIFRVSTLGAVDQVLDFDRAEGDELDLGALLAAFGPGDRTEDFVQSRTVDEGIMVAVDPSGSGVDFADTVLLRGLDSGSPVADPVPEPVAPGTIAVKIVDVAGVTPSTAPSQIGNGVNFLSHADDGSARLFVVDSRGEILLLRDGEIRPAPFLDLAGLRGDMLLAEHGADGLRTFAFHPDFDRPGTPGFGKLYTASTETVASADPETPVLTSGFDQVRHHDVLAEWTVDPAHPNRVDPESRREILRIEQPLVDHNIDLISFNPNAERGDPDYGLLYMALGDGGNFPSPDLDQAGQDPGSPLGKILRIDPLQDGARSYTVPEDNPFANNAAFLPEIWALGFRHPQRFSWDSEGDGSMLIADIGENSIEEINIGLPGGNYGWREREGRFAIDDSGELYQLPPFDGAFDYIYPAAQYDHDEGLAITGGFVYRGSEMPELSGRYVFGDIVNGRIFHVGIEDLEQGRETEIEELVLLRDGQPITLLDLVDAPRADLRSGRTRTARSISRQSRTAWSALSRRRRGGSWARSQRWTPSYRWPMPHRRSRAENACQSDRIQRSLDYQAVS